MKAILIDYDFDNVESKTLIDVFHSHDRTIFNEKTGCVLSFNTVGLDGAPMGKIVCKMSYLEARDLAERIAALCIGQQ